MICRAPSKTAEGSVDNSFPAAARSSDEQKSTMSTAFATPGGTIMAAKRRRSAFTNMKRSITKGPRLLGRRIKHFFKDDLYIDVSYQKAPPKMVARELSTLEVLAVYHRWLRGVQALLSIVVFILSLLSIGNSAFLVNCTIFIVSQAAILVICKTYQVKAQFSGVTNVLFEERNIFTSPYLLHMVAEIVLWNIQTPPFVFVGQQFCELLNYFIFLRLYSIIIYLSNAVYRHRTFCRAMSAISDLPLSTSFLIRTGLIHHKTRVVVTTVMCAWLTVGCLFARTQDLSLGDALWFSFQSLSTLGYGDITPSTLPGRVVAFIAWIMSYVIMAFLIINMYSLLQASDRSHNMQTLMECHELAQSLRGRSARVIQLAWRLHKARKVGPHAPSLKQTIYTLALSWGLMHMIAAMRHTRQQLNGAVRSLNEPSVHPLTGLSAYQYTAYLQVTERAAQQLQRVKDVDRVYLALRNRDVLASSLSRRDIESIIILPSDPLEPISTAPPATLMSKSSGTAASVAEMAVWRDRVAQLEQKCARLTEVLEAISAVAETHPPSMAVSQM
ncbi:ion transport protein-like protein [Leishmania tarentolae]|uniref:Ion transport protein-like protein n=1 Tax=Leishmania tarentolae TaxID=5689 RepID=A0A640KHW3_LEITA|nr:ion transport protein-like protein [Leishmania tarentolae]